MHEKTAGCPAAKVNHLFSGQPEIYHILCRVLARIWHWAATLHNKIYFP